MAERDPEDRTQEEIRRDAAGEPDDRTTRREEVELDLMDDGASEVGTVVGDEIE